MEFTHEIIKKFSHWGSMNNFRMSILRNFKILALIKTSYFAKELEKKKLLFYHYFITIYHYL